MERKYYRVWYYWSSDKVSRIETGFNRVSAESSANPAPRPCEWDKPEEDRPQRNRRIFRVAIYLQ